MSVLPQTCTAASNVRGVFSSKICTLCQLLVNLLIELSFVIALISSKFTFQGCSFMLVQDSMAGRDSQ